MEDFKKLIKESESVYEKSGPCTIWPLDWLRLIIWRRSRGSLLSIFLSNQVVTGDFLNSVQTGGLSSINWQICVKVVAGAEEDTVSIDRGEESRDWVEDEAGNQVLAGALFESKRIIIGFFDDTAGGTALGEDGCWNAWLPEPLKRWRATLWWLITTGLCLWP